jgi:capsular exopolysaccharide synthesis family protein
MPFKQNAPNGPRSAQTGASGFKSLPETELELRHIVLMLRRRKSVILAAFVIGVGLAVFWVLVTQKQYSSTATIEVNKESGNSLGLDDLSGIASELGGASDQLNVDLLTQQSVILSDSTALNVVEQLKLDKEPPYAIPAKDRELNTPLGVETGMPLENAPLQRERLLNIFAARLNVKLVKGTRLLTVTYTDTDPKRSTEIANAVVDAYIEEYTQARYQASSKASSWLSNQLADLKRRVADSQEKVEQYQRESGLVGMTMSPGAGRQSGGQAGPEGEVVSSDNVPLERLLDLNRDLTNAEVSRIAKEAIYRMTETQDPDVVLGIGSSALVTGLGQDSVLGPGSSDLQLLQQLRQQQAQLKVQIAGSSTKYGARNPALIQLHIQEDALNGQIRMELDRIRTRTKNDLDLAVLAENGIRQRVAAQEAEVNKVSAKADQLLLLQEEALSNRALYEDLYTKLEEASVAAGIKASNITLVDPARYPAHPSSPKTVRAVGLGAVLGLVLGTIAAALWDYFDDSLSTTEEVEEVTPMPVIGVIPDFLQKSSIASKYGSPLKAEKETDKKPAAWVMRAPRSHIAEAYRVLRTALLMTRAEQPPKVMLVTSGAPSEGKSTTCLNTASAFAIQGDRVLFLDADLRRPGAQRLFNCSNDVGLSNYLTSARPIEGLIQTSSDIETLFIMTTGPTPPNPSELLGSKRFAELIGQLRTQFDYIFIDSPPALVVTDSQLIASVADGYIVVIRAGKTTKRLFQRTLALMGKVSSHDLGIVVNGADTRSASYYGYGYTYGKDSYYVDGPR